MERGQVIEAISNRLRVKLPDAEKIFDKAQIGGEVCDGAKVWFEQRFRPNLVFIDEDGYSQMCIDALKILGKTAATDYGSSRQRDLGQLWADMTRGYLGELAFKLFLKKNGILSELDHEIGDIADYLPADIHRIKKDNQDWRLPNLKISVKTTKWNGIWLDIPGDQFNHSNVYVLVKVGTGRDHLFAYFKKISVFKDKILRVGKDKGLLSDSDADRLYDNLPTFSEIPAYICGFVKKPEAPGRDIFHYDGKMGRKNFKISKWNGKIMPEFLEQIRKNKKVFGEIQFEGIGKFAHSNGYLYNTGELKWKKDDWTALFDRL
jgi:hypothetical protein